MQISVHGIHMEVGDALTGHIKNTIETIVTKYFPKPLEAHISLTKGTHHDFSAEVIVHATKKITLKSTATAADAYIAFDAALEKIAARLRKYKNKLRDNHHKTHKDEMMHIVQHDALQTTHTFKNDENHEEASHLVIADMDTPIDHITVSEAVMRLDLGEYTALMFYNSSHDGLNMVYRRLDGNVGWVDPAGREKVMKNS